MLCHPSLLLWCAPMSKFSLHFSCAAFNFSLKFLIAFVATFLKHVYLCAHLKRTTNDARTPRCVDIAADTPWPFSNTPFPPQSSTLTQLHGIFTGLKRSLVYATMNNIKQSSPVYLNCAMKCNHISLTCLLQKASLMTVCFQAMLPDVVHYPSLDWPLPSHSTRFPHSLFLLFFFLTFLFNYLMSPLLALTPIKMRAAQPALNCLCVSDHKSFCCGCKLSVRLTYLCITTCLQFLFGSMIIDIIQQL